jgi:hypothetical protein
MKRFAPLFIAPFFMAAAACSDGPAENAGEDVDEAIEDVTGEEQGTFEEAGENLDDAADDAGDAIEDATDEPPR